jgi:hypothetical protein
VFKELGLIMPTGNLLIAGYKNASIVLSITPLGRDLLIRVLRVFKVEGCLVETLAIRSLFHA